MLIEHGMETERIPVFDGFVGSHRPFFLPDSLRRKEAAPGATWTRLWKMHGSITWRRIEQDGRFESSAPTDPAGEMIYPSFQKYDESRQQPYAAFTDRLVGSLSKMTRFWLSPGSVSATSTLTISYSAPSKAGRGLTSTPLIRGAARRGRFGEARGPRPNMIVVGPETGIIGGRRATWAPVERPDFMAAVYR